MCGERRGRARLLLSLRPPLLFLLLLLLLLALSIPGVGIDSGVSWAGLR